jgi:predicted dehydrogenase/threonine dehydrogenase-like Zn-dependent dehydrogenase
LKILGQRLSDGSVEVVEAPDPQIQPGFIRVRTLFSAISPGTEGSKIRAGQMSLLGKARAKPEQAVQAFGMIRTLGLRNTLRKVQSKLVGAQPLGYSLCGRVLETSGDCRDLGIGDLVACAGGGYANHADQVVIPANLAARVPEGVDPADAAFTTLGAIALQGIRIAAPTQGECALVIGLGIIGQLAGQLLKAGGCRVIGADISSSAIDLAVSSGSVDRAVNSGEETVLSAIEAFSRGRGVDLVLICAGARGNGPVELAGAACRKKGRITVIGAVGMDIPREDYYRKELAFTVSCSYGPGRYDPSYEEGGRDYPLSHVRWTEGRNMEAVLDGMASGVVKPSPLVTHRVRFEDAPGAYSMIAGATEPFCGIVLDYGIPPAVMGSSASIALQTGNGEKTGGGKGLSFYGTGSFAQTFLLPTVSRRRDFRLEAICTRTGLTAADTGKRFGFARAVSSLEEILSDEKTDAVFIATRHDQHGPATAGVLGTGKHVFVEKPLCLSMEELGAIARTYLARKSPPVLMVGFNRRFSKAAVIARRFLEGTGQPLAITYTVAAGRIPVEHWTQDPLQGGGRIIGEACHFIDLMQYLTGAEPVSVRSVSIVREDGAVPLRDNSMLLFSFSNGSIGSIAYIADASKKNPKERIEASSGGRTAVIDNFHRVDLFGSGKSSRRCSGKGHEEEVASFLESIGSGRPPIPFRSILATTIASIRAEESLAGGGTLAIDTDGFLASANE